MRLRQLRMIVAAVMALGAMLSLPAGAAAAGAPTVSGVSAANLQGTSAFLRGQVDRNELPTTYRFEYVEQATYEADQPGGWQQATATATTPIGSGAGERTATASLSDLRPLTEYRFRLVATNEAGSASAEATFTTTAGFGFLPGEEGVAIEVRERDGFLARQAGSHPSSMTIATGFNLAGKSSGEPGVPFSDGDLRELRIDLPQGFVENPTAVGQCTIAEFNTPRESPFQQSLSGESCPLDSQIGIVAVDSSYAGGATRYFGVFNLAPPPGAPAQIGFNPYGMPIAFDREIRTEGGGFALSLRLRDFPQRFDVHGMRMTLWGTPWLIEHDKQRGDCLNEIDPTAGFGTSAQLEDEPPLPQYPAGPKYEPGTCSVGNPRVAETHPKAYLTLPTICGVPMRFGVRARSWQGEEAERSLTSLDSGGQPDGLEGCNFLARDSVGSVRPATDRASSATALDFDLEVDQAGLIDNVTERGREILSVRAPSQTKEAVVALPVGMTINPSVGSGLGVCTPAQYAAETATSDPGAACPNASKIGTVTVRTPLAEAPLEGSLFLAQPDDPATAAPGAENPFDALVGLYMIAKLPSRGLIVKLAGKVDPDPASGRLVTTFQNLPQLPYTRFTVHFREGQRSPLASPPECGSYQVGIALTPWLEPNDVFHGSSAFTLSHGVGGGPCPAGALPFQPQSQAGNLNRSAGSYSPFYLRLTRTDSEQEFTSYSATLAPGLLGKLAGVTRCPEAAIAAAKTNRGFAETANPSCPASSRLGHTLSGYGLGGTLAYAPGTLYLAGPYNGSPISIVAVNAATVGPFDLGVVIVRSAIRIDPRSAQASIDALGSDPIPHILKGIPLHLRDIRVYLDRPEFTLNPTSCDATAVISTLTGAGALLGDPGDDTRADVPNHFQASNCSALGFAPKLKISLRGGTKRGRYPALHAVYRPPAGGANLERVAVTLPPSIFLAQEHIDTVCTRGRYAAEDCPPGSIYGRARAVTPLLDEPLEGPVVLRPSDNPLPDLVADLRGGGVRIEVPARIDSKGGGLRGTFVGLPDAPVTSFTMDLFGGKRGVLANADNLCASAQRFGAPMIAHNNKTATLRPRLGVKCKGKRTAGKRKGGRK